MDAAFCSAERTTLVGSMTPASTRFSYFSFWALKPSSASLASRTRATTTAPSWPAFSAIWRRGSSRARRMMLTPTCSSPVSFRASTALMRAEQGDAAAGDDALLDGRLGRVHRVLDAGLLLLHLGLGGRADA